MNPNSIDTPDLTAYALGELSPPQGREVHALLAALPAALSELEQVEAVTDALRQGAPIPQQRLSPAQRHAVLHPTNLPRHVGLRMPVPAKRRPATHFAVLAPMAKVAAVVAVTGMAFYLGRHPPGGVAAGQLSDEVLAGEYAMAESATAEDGAEYPAARTIIMMTQPPATAEEREWREMEMAGPPAPTVGPQLAKLAAVPQLAAGVVVVADQSPEAAAKKAPTVARRTSPANVVAAAQPAKAPEAGTPARTVIRGDFASVPAGAAFQSASRKSVSEVVLRPARVRPLPARVAPGVLLAAPMRPESGAPQAREARPRPGEVYIHSWSAEVANCPWNESNRLMRVVIQLPADQPSARFVDHTAVVQVAFDPNTVRDFRLLYERYQPAAEVRSAGAYVIWYELSPNGSADSTRDSGRQVATVTLPGGRFTTQAVEPFDGSKLRVLDRGQPWQMAREDYIFESSLVGFSLLLRGAPLAVNLNHQLVLNLATKGRGADASGERGRFIRLVNEAKAAAGL